MPDGLLYRSADKNDGEFLTGMYVREWRTAPKTCSVPEKRLQTDTISTNAD